MRVTAEINGATAAPDCIFSKDFCMAIDSTLLPIYIIDPDTYEMLYCNELMRSYMGRDPRGELCHKAIRGLDEPCPGCVAKRLRQEGINEPEEYHTPQGRWMLVRVSPLNWQGREVYKLSCTDISKQKELEAELRLRSQEYGAVVLQSVSGVMRYDIASDTATVNVDRELNRVPEHRVENYLETAREMGMVESDSRPTAQQMFADIRNGQPCRGYDIRLKLQDGKLRWCHLEYVLIEDEDGKPYRAVISFFDNTEKRERELAYERWSEKLNHLMDMHTAYMEVDLSRDTIEADGRVGTWNLKSDNKRFSSFIEELAAARVHAEDSRDFLWFFDRERLIGQFLVGNSEGSLECRMMVKGEPQWFRAELQMASDPQSGSIKASIVVSNVDADIRERDRLRNEAERDSMTGLYNRAVAESNIIRVLSGSNGERCCFLVIDLDDLRGINSRLGHPEGDKALCAIADCMRAQFRKTDIMGRIGGDEFVVLLRNVPGMEGLRASISGFLRRIREVRIGPLADKDIHVSVGGTIGTAGEIDFETLYEQADLALYYTKATGKDGFNLYVPEMEKREVSYQPRSEISLESLNVFGSAELKKLMHAVSSYFPMVFSVNLTQNSYYMMEYASYPMQRHNDQGSFDELVADGAMTFHPDDRESFTAHFARKNLLAAYARGERIIRHTGRQLGDDGIYRKTHTVVIMMPEDPTGDICEITLSHVIPEE